MLRVLVRDKAAASDTGDCHGQSQFSTVACAWRKPATRPSATIVFVTPMLAKDFRSFADLVAAYERDRDYRIVQSRRPGSQVVILALHGGSIEAHTSDIAREIAGQEFNLYLFGGLLKAGASRSTTAARASHRSSARACSKSSRRRTCYPRTGLVCRPEFAVWPAEFRCRTMEPIRAQSKGPLCMSLGDCYGSTPLKNSVGKEFQAPSC